MACDLTLGRLEPCKDSNGGIKAVYFINYGELGEVTTGSDGEITDFASGATAYKYELKGNSSLEQTINSSRENGTTYFEQTVNLTLKKLDKATTNQVKLMSYGRPHIVVEDMNGNAFLVGAEHGADVTGGSIFTGAAMGDMSGYSITLSGQEKAPAAHIEGAVKNDPFAGLTSATMTIVEGVSA